MRCNHRQETSRAFTRRALVLALGVAVLITLVATVAVGGDGAACSGIRRVVVIHFDTTRYDDLSCNGGLGSTPNCDAVAARGMRYTNAIVTSPTTSPSIATFLTGRVPNRHGVYDVGGALSDELTTIAEVLKSHGFTTGGFTSNRIVGRMGSETRRAAGFDQGFDVYETDFEIAMVPEGQSANATARAHAPRLVDRALDFVEANRDEPFFLWMLHLDPHTPYAPPEPWESMYLEHADLLAASQVLNPAVIHYSAWVPGRVDSHEYVARHLAEVTMVDHEIGRLLGRIEQLPGPTLLIITSDHGESLGDVGYWFNHGGNIRQPSMHVPLIIACDGRVPVGISDALAANIDLAPTILDLVNISLSELNGNGRSLVPTFDDEDPWPARMIPIQKHAARKSRGVRSGRFCLQSRFNPVTGLPVRSFFYDLQNDPGETRDVSEEFPEAFEAHLAVQRDWFARPAWAGAGPMHDPEILRQLQSLGYVR